MAPKLPTPEVGATVEVKLYRARNPVRTVSRVVLAHATPGKRKAPVVDLGGRRMHLCRVYVSPTVFHWGAFFELHHSIPTV